MCGRYTLIADLGDLAQRFEFDGSDFSYDPGYNIAPTESVLTVRNMEGREATFMRWGLVPFGAKDPKIGARMINARAQTATPVDNVQWFVYVVRDLFAVAIQTLSRTGLSPSP